MTTIFIIVLYNILKNFCLYLVFENSINFFEKFPYKLFTKSENILVFLKYSRSFQNISVLFRNKNLKLNILHF